MPWLASLAGGTAGLIASQGDRNNANTQEQQAVQQWLSLNVPDVQQQQVELQHYQQTGSLSPALETAFKQSPSAMNSITQNPALQGAQMDALGQLQQEGLQGGLTLADRATLQDSLNSTNAQAAGRNGALMNQFQSQGQGGSGLQLQAQLANNQNATQNAGNASLQAAAASRARALQAVSGAGNLAGQMANTQYQQQADRANANDAINRFNTSNSQNVANTNVQNANQAQQYNLGLQQSIANQNTQLSNQQQMYNKGLLQQNYEDQAQKAAGAAGAQSGYANYLGQQANAIGKQYAGIGSGVAKGLSAYGDDDDDETKGGSTGASAAAAGFV